MFYQGRKRGGEIRRGEREREGERKGGNLSPREGERRGDKKWERERSGEKGRLSVTRDMI